MDLRSSSLITMPKRRSLGWVALLAAIAAFAALITRFPLVAFALAGCIILVGITWPRWTHLDIEYFAGAVFISTALMGLPRLVQIGSYTLDAGLSIVTVAFAGLLLAHDSWNIDVAWRWLW